MNGTTDTAVPALSEQDGSAEARYLHAALILPCAGCPSQCDTEGSGYLSASCVVAERVRTLRALEGKVTSSCHGCSGTTGVLGGDCADCPTVVGDEL